MAIATGIPPSVWAEEGEQAIATAIDLLNPKRRPSGDGTSQMSG